jgi:hypothetical protein
MSDEDVLRRELSAEPNTFLLQLRCDLRWDVEAFERLTKAMETYAAAHENDESIPRWVAEGFWYTSWFVKDWSTHEGFPREHPPSYYELAYQQLHELAYWMFVGTRG